jgi:hypothetical protein
MTAPPPAERPTIEDLAEDALATLLATLASYRRLIGQIHYQVTNVAQSSGGAVVEIRRLLDDFDSESSTASVGGGSPDGAADVGARPPHARPAVTPPVDGGAGTPPRPSGRQTALDIVERARQRLDADRPVSPARAGDPLGLAEDFYPVGHHYGRPGDLIPSSDPALGAGDGAR